ncbi:helix-turn-helix transcriptional regulator [Bradyrhizobium pachyrhizi]|uniref:helix-turn-helix domain-containing protein n=1 Tax=Bradyrhizobium pachyrhizi TaxID=280333 RepID=UPI0024B11529|nr:helix-turn-helix transcriptional regulator [Bradyrhizobium pachyrhizi]WFU59755.1 helix-turn-helix transcriptional regulator [Bradyrhizobium pachyrhizi]
MSQEDLAAAARTRQALVSAIEIGTANPTLASLAKLAATLDVSLAELFSRDDESGRPRRDAARGHLSFNDLLTISFWGATSLRHTFRRAQGPPPGQASPWGKNRRRAA